MEKEQLNKGYMNGEVLFTIYEDANNLFSIVKVKIHETNEPFEEKEIVAKGHFAQLQKGVVYKFYGKLVDHPKFGRQYDIETYETVIPETKEAVIQFLSSDLFYGVGKKTATSIVNTLGENAIEKILDDPDCLFSVPTLKKTTIQSLVETLQKHHGFEKVAVQLTKYGISLKMAQTIYNHYRDETMVLLENNPYQLVFDIEGFGFLTADKIGEIKEIPKTDVNRIRASCIHALQLSVLEGHVFLPLEECISSMKSILRTDEITEETLVEQVEQLSNEKYVVLKDGNVYLRSLYFAEDNFSTHVQRILQKKIDTEVTDAELMKLIGEIEEEESLSYGMEQFEAIKQAIHSKLMILTGGPGTGKTTVIKGIIKVYAKIHDLSIYPHDYDNSNDYPFILTAPTGRAAKRLQESTGLKAQTIHRLLGWDGNNSFEKNEYEKLSGKFLIVDEFSMVDTWLANHLFKAIPSDMQILLVGDEDQLPSVGPGQVLSDLLSSRLIPFVKLTEVYRQKEGSKIIQLAHKIKNNECTEDDLTKADDFSFIPCKPYQVIDVVTTVVERAKLKGVDASDIQILAPMYKTEAGIHAINKQMQQLLNPPAKSKRERTFNDVIYRVGDRVIQLVNQPEDGVYNGDIGEIIQIFSARETTDKQEQIVISFEDKEVVYTRNDYINFMHAYCISIHKSQGSEFPIVVLPVVQTYRRMLRKNLLYTAITRSTKSLIICGEIEAFMDGIETIDTDNRYTTLEKLLKLKLDGKIEDEIEEQEVKELTPYDFM